MSKKKVLLSLAEFASRTGLSRRTITNLVLSREIKSIRVGRRRLLPVAELSRFVDSDHRTAPPKRSRNKSSRKRLPKPATPRRRSLPRPKRTKRPRARIARNARYQKFVAPKTAKQYFALSRKAQELWDRIVQVPALLRARNSTLRKAAKQLSVTEEVVLRLARPAFR